MEELKISPMELKNLIGNVNIIGKGYYGIVFEYKDKLIKMDNVLYDIIKMSRTKKVDENFGEYRDNHYMDQFVDLDQIEYLSGLKDKIKLTRMPLGVVKMNDLYPGIILSPHYEHKKLDDFPRGNYKELLMILRNILLAVRELEDNGLRHDDLKRPGSGRAYNILYKGVTPQIIDLDGVFLKYDNVNSFRIMYQQLGEIILDFFKLNNLTSEMNFYEINNPSGVSHLLDELDYKTRGI